jgi:hypothetical protein
VETLRALLGRGEVSAADKLQGAFNVIAAYHAARLVPPLIERLGATVLSGPFAGMQLLGRASEGAYIPKLLGSYESELHPLIERTTTADYDAIINIGCAEGYYAVGMARRVNTPIHAFDIDERARRMCQELARLNGVQDQLRIGMEFHPDNFARYSGQQVLVLCDIEGAELSLFDPTAWPNLRQMDLLIEIHQVDGRWTSNDLLPRFVGSHVVTEIAQQPRDAAQFAVLSDLSDTDRFFALLERLEPTRWAFLEATTKTRPTA